MSDAAIELEGIRVHVSGKVILEIPALAVPNQSRLAVLGPNGAGKSTLLQVMALLRQADSGEVMVEGERADRNNARRLRSRMAVVFQAPLLFDTSVLANAASGLGFRGVNKRDALERAHEWLKQFGVDHLANRSPHLLSGGEARRVSLARALAIEPAILLLDEPFAGLDSETRETLLPELSARFQTSTITTVLVTHDIREAEAICTSKMYMRSGKIAALHNIPGGVVERSIHSAK